MQAWTWTEWIFQLALIPVGLLYANAFEWFAHKYVLHGLGRKRDSWWSFHWRDHHGNARKYNFHDEEYDRPLWEWNSQSKEIVALLIAAIFHFPLFYYAPFMAVTLVYGVFNYYIVHCRAHRNPEWAKTHLKWHYDHHMGRNQDANWCVTKPWFDRWMGTDNAAEGASSKSQIKS